jgi:hypothetical protein
MGALKVTDGAGTPVDMSEDFRSALISQVVNKINGTDISFKKDDSAVIDYFK